jgi:protein gp37
MTNMDMIHDQIRFGPWPLPNVWLGVSVEDQKTADERIPLLLKTPAAVRFVSYEPALGPVDFERWVDRTTDGSGIDWLIIGGESGPGARPCDIEWIRSAVRQCKAAGVAVFMKQLGAKPGKSIRAPDSDHSGRDYWEPIKLKSRKGGDPTEWPADLRVREFPK